MEFASRPLRARALGAGLLLTVLGGLLAVPLAGCKGKRQPERRAAPRQLHALVGRVTDEAGQPVPEARIVALLPGDAGANAMVAVTDLGGRFVFDRLPPGRYGVLIEASGLAAMQLPAVPVPGPEIQARLPALGRALSGTVVAGGAPAPGARVRIAGEGAGPARETLSDDQGRFVFHGLGQGPYALRATRGTLASPALAGVPPDGASTRLELGAGSSVEGQVVDDAGRALPGVEVSVEAAPEDGLPEVATTAANGRFRVGPLPPGRFRAIARAEGYVLAAPAAVALTAGAATPAVRLSLLRGASLQGRVADAHGTPIAGALVRCVRDGGEVQDLAVVFAPLPLAAEAAAAGPAAATLAGRPLGSAESTRSDANGAFHLDGLLPGTVHLEVTRSPSAPLAAGPWTLGPGERRDVGALVLNDGVAVRGHVRDGAGGPVAGARVTVAPSPGIFAETDGAGGFVLTVPAARYTLTAAAGVGQVSVPLDLSGGAAPPELTLVLAPARADGVAEGVVRDSGHRPLARARVRAFALDAAPGAAPLASGVTDPGGHFKLTHVPAQPMRLEIDHPSYPPAVATTTPGAASDLTVPIPGGIDGEVHDRITGAVVPRARVAATGPDGQKATAAGKGGAGSFGFRLLRLRPGRWALTASAPGYRPATREFDVPEGAILGEASVRGVRLDLDPAR